MISLLFVTRAGLAWLDIVDNWANSINLIVVGILECIAVGWSRKVDLHSILFEVNRNAKKFKAPYWWFASSVKVISPILLIGLFVWNMIVLFAQKHGSYDPNYPIWAQIAAGWAVSALVFASGFIAKGIVRAKAKKGFVEDEVVWENENDAA